MIRRATLAVGLLGLGLPAVATAAPRRNTVFLDFGGGPLGSGGGPDQATCVASQFLYPMFLGSEGAAEIALTEAQRLMAPYGVRVVGERPPAPLPFTHVRVGGEPQTLGLDSRLNGLACEVDCDDEAVSDTVFVFADKWVDTAVLGEAEQEQLALQIGRIAIHEAAHAWGLEHTGGTESIMARFPSAAVPRFVEGCQELDLDGDTQCPDARARHCAAGQQDAHAELLALFGDGEPDTTRPHAEILWPPDGWVLLPGDTLEVQLEVDDDHAGFGWSLEVPQLHWRHESTEPGAHEIELVVPEGRYTLHLEAIDHDRNVGEAEVTFVVEPEAEPGQGPSEPRAQCACRSGREIPPLPLGLVLAILGLRGRRRQ